MGVSKLIEENRVNSVNELVKKIDSNSYGLCKVEATHIDSFFENEYVSGMYRLFGHRGEIVESTFDLKDKVFLDISIDIRNVDELKIRDCVFVEKVVISSRHNSYIDITNCIFCKGLKIVGSYRTLCILMSNISDLTLSNGSMAITLQYNQIYNFMVDEVVIEVDSFSENKVENVFIYELKSCNGPIFNHRQFNLRNLGKHAKTNEAPHKYVFRKFRDKKIKANYENEIKEKTIGFVINHSSITQNKNYHNSLKYRYHLNKQGSVFSKCFYILTGGFLKPSLWIVYALLVILGFGLIYSLPCFSFKVVARAMWGPLDNLYQGIYFSGITFTTVGYGDIQPSGFAKVLVLIEALAGISIMSSFLVSLVRRYID